MDFKKFTKIFYDGYTPSQDMFELWCLILWLQNFLPSIKVAVEIGTFRGGTLRFWRELLQPDGTLISVDLNDRGFMEEVINNFANDCRVKFIIGDSTDSNTVMLVKNIIPKPVDMVFIDGCHDSDVVKQDIDNYGKMLRENGVLILHDIINPNIRPLWNNLKGEHKMGIAEVSVTDTPQTLLGMRKCSRVMEIYGSFPHGIGIYVV